jgi:hypothetical protein
MYAPAPLTPRSWATLPVRLHSVLCGSSSVLQASSQAPFTLAPACPATFRTQSSSSRHSAEERSHKLSSNPTSGAPGLTIAARRAHCCETFWHLCVVGRGHVSLLTNLDTGPPKPFSDIGHLLLYYPTCSRLAKAYIHSICIVRVSSAEEFGFRKSFRSCSRKSVISRLARIHSVAALQPRQEGCVSESYARSTRQHFMGSHTAGRCRCWPRAQVFLQCPVRPPPLHAALHIHADGTTIGA